MTLQFVLMLKEILPSVQSFAFSVIVITTPVRSPSHYSAGNISESITSTLVTITFTNRHISTRQNHDPNFPQYILAKRPVFTNVFFLKLTTESMGGLNESVKRRPSIRLSLATTAFVIDCLLFGSRARQKHGFCYDLGTCYIMIWTLYAGVMDIPVFS